LLIVIFLRAAVVSFPDSNKSKLAMEKLHNFNFGGKNLFLEYFIDKNGVIIVLINTKITKTK
jgi:hypothetical protein